jgi:hypothetical protein
MATPASAASCFSRANKRTISGRTLGKTGTAGPSQSHVDDIAADGTGLLVHVPAEAVLLGAIVSRQIRGPMRRSNFGGSRCST